MNEGECFECDAPAEHHHHVVPASLGGSRTVPLCALCHATIHDTGITTSDLTSRALRNKAARGEYTGGPVTYGYRVSADGVSLEIDDYEQAVIGEIRRLRLLGISLRKIADKLSERGFQSRTERDLSKSSVAGVAGKFSTGTVHRIVNSERLADGAKFSPSAINRIAKGARMVDE